MEKTLQGINSLRAQPQEKGHRNALFADAGARTLTRSTTNEAYACNPSSSHPIAGNNLKNRLVAAASLEVDAFLNCWWKISRSCSRADCSACAGGSGLSAVGCAQSMRSWQGIVRQSTYDRAFCERAGGYIQREGHCSSAMSRCRLPVLGVHRRPKG